MGFDNSVPAVGMLSAVGSVDFYRHINARNDALTRLLMADYVNTTYFPSVYKTS